MITTEQKKKGIQVVYSCEYEEMIDAHKIKAQFWYNVNKKTKESLNCLINELDMRRFG